MSNIWWSRCSCKGNCSRSYSGELHAYGAMLGPTMRVPLIDGKTLKEMMKSGNEGMANVQGVGL